VESRLVSWCNIAITLIDSKTGGDPAVVDVIACLQQLTRFRRAER